MSVVERNYNVAFACFLFRLPDQLPFRSEPSVALGLDSRGPDTGAGGKNFKYFLYFGKTIGLCRSMALEYPRGRSLERPTGLPFWRSSSATSCRYFNN